jgi:eukaryotic-like serine/threonine-protein kinase
MAAPPSETRVVDRGETVGRFVLIGLLGRGGMGEVYAAYDPELDRKVAVKIVRARSTDGEARLLREAQAIAKLQHPNVVVVYDVGSFRDTVFIAMEFIDGPTLGHWMSVERRPWRETLRVFQAAGRGLEAAHALGMVHRDFKPDNVMLTKDGQVRVMDFGLARQFDDGDEAGTPVPAAPAPAPAADPDETMSAGPGSTRSTGLQTSGRYLDLKLTETGVQVGTPAYMAPEQYSALRSDARSDQFSFSVALYEALYEERPFAGHTVPEIMTNVSAGRVSPAPERARVPGWLRRVVLRGLSTDPAARHPSMSALLAALEADPSTRRRRWTFALAGVAVLGGLAIGWSREGAARRALCAGGAARLAGVWEPDPALTPRKEAIRARFATIGKSYAASAFTGAARLLDDFSARWVAMYRDVCEATAVRGEPSAEVRDLRMACLDERRETLSALTELFTTADDGVVQNAVSAAGALPRLDECADISALRAVVKRPQDPASSRRAAQLGADLAHVMALRASGQCAAADRTVAPLVAAARAADDRPLLADALVEMGLLAQFCVQPLRGVEALKEAYATAISAHKDSVAIAASSEVALLSANRLGDLTAARDWVRIARASLDGHGRDDHLEGMVLTAEGMLLTSQGDYDRAMVKIRDAQAITAKALGADHPFALTGLMNVGDLLVTAGRYEEARVADERAIAAAERVFGPVHQIVAATSNNLCEALNHLGRFADARAACGRALAIWTEIGAEPSIHAYGLTGLGESLLGEGHPGEAVAPLEQAVAARERAKVSPALLGESRFALARALWSRAPERPHALALARRASVDRASDAKAVAEIDAWLARPTTR